MRLRCGKIPRHSVLRDYVGELRLNESNEGGEQIPVVVVVARERDPPAAVYGPFGHHVLGPAWGQDVMNCVPPV